MAEKPKAPVLPFTAENENEWESELADWDAHLPIQDAPAASGAEPLPEPQPIGIVPDEENPFADTPTTVTSGTPVDDAGHFEASADEFSERHTPHSDVYATITSSVDSAETLFQREPLVEPPAPILADPLPEMAAEPWREQLELLIKVPARAVAAPPGEEERRAWLSLFAAEMEVADTAAQQAALTLTAARLTDALGDVDAAIALCDDALTLQPGSAAALRARLRLAERQGDATGALETIGLLAAAVEGDERVHYRAVRSEWTLALTGKIDAEDLAALGEGLARALVEAEVALRQGDGRQAATILEDAAARLGGRPGASLASLAARLAETSGDVTASARQRTLAARLATPGRERLMVAVGQLRDAARATPAAAAPLLDQLLALLPAGDFKVGCARWAAGIARRAGAGEGARERAASLLADPANGGVSPASLRDRLDHERRMIRDGAADGGGAGDGERVARVRGLLADAGAVWTTRAGRACLDVMAAELALDEGAAAAAVAAGDVDAANRRALAIATTGLEAAPGTVPLAIAAEEVARRAVDRDLRLEALRVWARFDPARAAYALSLVVDMLESTLARDPTAGDEAVRQALGELVSAAPMATAFWTLAARERAAGRKAEAADALARGAAAWGSSELGAPLRKLADALRADAPASWPTPAPGRGSPRVGETPESVLAEAPAEPAALALITLGEGGDAGRLAAIYSAAAAAGGAGEKFWRLQAAGWLTRAGRAVEALESALALFASDRAWEPGRELAERLVRVDPDPARRARALLAFDPDGVGSDARVALRAAEAKEELGDAAGATAILRELLAGPLGADSARGLARLGARGAPPEPEAAPQVMPQVMPQVTPDDGPRGRVRAFLAAARAGRSAELVERLEREPPHQDVATAPGLYLAALLRESSSDESAASDSARLLTAAVAWRTAPRAADRPGLLAAWRAAEGAPGATPAPAAPVPAGDALAEIADRLSRGDDDSGDEGSGGGGGSEPGGERAGDARSSAALLLRASERDLAAGDVARSEARLRVALERDRDCLPAVRALRRALVARGALGEAAALCAREAELLQGRDERIRVLLLSAELARVARAAAAAGDASLATPSLAPAATPSASGAEPAPEAAPLPTPASESGRHRAAAAAAQRPTAAAVIEPLRRILELDPGHVAAFEQLREALIASGDQAALAALLAARVTVATNPFEVAALRLARAELLAGPLADAGGAKVELRAILAREPQHGKALARLADLHYDSGAFGEAAELYLKRALAERSPERLREIFLRIGRIYTRHERDAKRAADAYKRVLQLEGDNREALVALSDLLIEIGDIRNAIAVTDRLVEQTPDVDKRVPYLIRLGQLWEQAGDLRQAGARFRRAADDAPRNLLAVGEMVRHFERTRDLPGRRALLDHALLLLRADLHAGKVDVEVLRALVHVMQWRGRTAAAAAGAQLLAVVSPDAADRAAAAGWAAPPARGRRLTALARPDVDERLFPAGLPSGVRNIFRIIGEPLAKSVSDLKRYELSRGDRVARGQGPRELIDVIAAELGVKDVDVYVKPARAAGEPAWLAVEPGEPPALILGASILALGPPAIRFAGGRLLRLASTHLDLVMRETPPQTGALVGGVVRQFVTDYRHPDVPTDVMSTGAAIVGRVLSRRLRQEVMPFAIESAGALDLWALHQAVRDGANQVGLLASGNLPSALAVVLSLAGHALTLGHVAANPETLALLDFALSDAYDELVREVEGTGPA